MYTLGIETFLAVIRAQSLSRAAEDLHLSQSTVSQRIKVLEREMGSLLIKRGQGIKKLHLTPTGEQFLVLAERWSTIWRETQILQAQGPQLFIVIGSVNTFNAFALPPIYRALIKHSPPIKCEGRTLHSIELYSEVEKKQVDVGFSIRERVHPNVTVSKCFESPFVILRPAGGTTPEHTIIHPSELDPAHEILAPYGDVFQAWHDRWLDPLYPAQVKLDNTGLLLEVLKDPLQWTIIPKWIADMFCQSGLYSVFRLAEAPPNYTCYKLTHTYCTSTVRKTLDILDYYLELLLPRHIVSAGDKM